MDGWLIETSILCLRTAAVLTPVALVVDAGILAWASYMAWTRR